MNIDATKIITKLTKRHKYQIYKWLKDEIDIGNNFFYNLSIILKQFRNRNGICILNSNNEAIGFIIYIKYIQYAEIQIANIKHIYKGQGLGKIMLNYLESKLITEGIKILQLFCSPVDSKSIWLRLGFKEFDDKEILKRQNRIYLYKIIVEYIHPKRCISNKNISYIEINNLIWETNELERNTYIIYCVEANTTVKYKLNGKTLYSDVAKHFKNYYEGYYLIIDKL